MKTWPTRTSREMLDYSYDWTPCLKDDAIQSVDAQASNGLKVDRITTVGNVQVVWLSGGEPGVAAVDLLMTTVGGRTFDQQVTMTIRNRLPV